VILGRAPGSLDQPARHVRVERVAPVGPVHGDGEEALVEALEDDLSLLMGCGFRCYWLWDSDLTAVIARSEATKAIHSFFAA